MYLMSSPTNSAPFSIVYTDRNGKTLGTCGTQYRTIDDALDVLEDWRDVDPDPTLRIVDCDGEVVAS